MSSTVQRKEMRASFRKATLDAWEEYRATRLHAAAKQVDEWLASWGTDGELPVPECRR